MPLPQNLEDSPQAAGQSAEEYENWLQTMPSDAAAEFVLNKSASERAELFNRFPFLRQKAQDYMSARGERFPHLLPEFFPEHMRTDRYGERISEEAWRNQKPVPQQAQASAPQPSRGGVTGGFVLGSPQPSGAQRTPEQANNWVQQPASQAASGGESGDGAAAAEGPEGVQSGAKWHNQMREQLLKRAEALSRENLSPYGLDEATISANNQEIQRLRQQAESLGSPHKIPFSVTGSEEPVLFTPTQLERAAQDPIFARRIYETATGISNAPSGDIEEFRQRIIFQNPKLNEQVGHQKTFEGQFLPKERREYINWLAGESEESRENLLNLEALRNPSTAEHARFLLSHPEEQRRNLLGDPYFDSEEQLFKRLKVPSEREQLGERFGRVAPMNQLHEQARRLVQRNIGSQDEAFKVAQEELDAARNTDTLNPVMAHVNEGLRPTYENTAGYRNSFERNVIDNIREESRHNFLEEVMPHITGSFASQGAFHSGARQNAINKFAEKMAKNREREISKLYYQNEESNLNRVAEENERQLRAAEITARAVNAQQDAKLKTAEIARNHGLLAKEAAKHDVEAVSQFARQQQQQAQNALNAKRAAYEESQMEPHRRLQGYANLFAGHPSPTTSTLGGSNLPPPTPPDPYTTGAGIMGQMLALQKQQQGVAAHKKGGRVKNKFADGGVVEKYKKMMTQLPEQQYAPDMKQLASQMRNEHIDPMANWLQHVSAQMLANSRGDPLTNFGIGAQNAEKAMTGHRAHMLAAKEKAANLYNAMNKSRHSQAQLLASMDNNHLDQEERKSQHAETRRQHDEQERHHRAVESFNASKLSSKNNNSLSTGDYKILDQRLKEEEKNKDKWFGANESESLKTNAIIKAAGKGHSPLISMPLYDEWQSDKNTKLNFLDYIDSKLNKNNVGVSTEMPEHSKEDENLPIKEDDSIDAKIKELKQRQVMIDKQRNASNG